MIDLRLLRDNLNAVKDTVRKKHVNVDVDKVIELDERRRELIQESEAVKAEQNARSKKGKVSGKEREELKELKQKFKGLEDELKKVEEEFTMLFEQLPNPPADDVPEGKDESDNEVMREVGEPAKFDFTPKDHLELGEQLGIIDVERAAKVSGSRFAYLKGAAAQLEFALIQFAMDTLLEKGFTPVIPPVLIKKENMKGMGYLEHGGEEDMYVFDKDGLVLVGTSEQSIGPMHKDEIFSKAELPCRYAGFSTCFRREAGSYGKDTRGILRVHQFDKIEMFSFTSPESGDSEHAMMLDIEEELFSKLGIPYRVMRICSGDLGAPAARKYDIEAWMPSQNMYREVTSTSTTTDFQSRRLNIRYRNGQELDFVHTLNGTAIAVGRTIVAILENFQTKKGTITVPEALRRHMGGMNEIKGKK